MNTRVSTFTSFSIFEKYSPDNVLQKSIVVWFLAAMLGQLTFAFYIAIRYGLPVLSGQYEDVNLSGNVTGYVAGDFSGNVMLYVHLVPAAILSLCGMLQLIPSLRQKFPVVHRWNGRMFLFLGLTGAITGLYLTWLRGSRLSDLGAIGVTVNGILIIVAGHLAWRYAVAKKFQQHKRWAVHAFFLVNGVWTFRLFLMGWYMVNQGPNGNNNTLDGPTDMVLSFACYLIPMLLAELVFWGQRQQNNAKKWLVSFTMMLGSAITVLCVATAIMGMWSPRIAKSLEAFAMAIS